MTHLVNIFLSLMLMLVASMGAYGEDDAQPQTVPAAYRSIANTVGVDPAKLYEHALGSAVVLTDGEQRPWPWTLRVVGTMNTSKVQHYRNRHAAYSALRHYRAQGEAVIVGLVLLPCCVEQVQDETLWQLLDPITNLRLGARLLIKNKDDDLSSDSVGQQTLPFSIDSRKRDRYVATVTRIAQQHQLDRALVEAVISAESAFNPRALSPAGAQGLMQLMPATAKRFSVNDPYDPEQNIRGGSRYLRLLLDQFQDTRLALAAYNAGENAVIRYGYTIPPYRETQQYVERVLAFYRYYQHEESSG